MQKNSKEFVRKPEEIFIPIDFINRIDKVIGTGKSVYLTREEFVKGAVERKLMEIKGLDSG